MRILSIHAGSMWYRALKKTKIAEPVEKFEDRMEECVVLFCCVEKLDEKNPLHVIGSAKKNVMARLAQLKVGRVMIYPYAHLTSSLGSPDFALGILKGLEQRLSEESITVRRAPFGWYKEFMIHAKGHPLADLSMTICPYEGTDCDFTCPYCHHPVRGDDMNRVCPGPDSCATTGDSGLRTTATGPADRPGGAAPSVPGKQS